MCDEHTFIFIKNVFRHSSVKWICGYREPQGPLIVTFSHMGNIINIIISIS